jgi:DMSO/TMAO reductase YedYZ molybdopterin-dependent catalytic subunit
MKASARGAVAGLLAAGIALGVAQLVAGVLRPASSPVVVVGETAIDHTPPWLKNFAIQTFGANDKLALSIGILAVLAVYAVIVGVVASRRFRYGLIGIAIFAAIGLSAALTRPGAQATDVLPTLIGAGGAVAAMWVLLARPPAPGAEVPSGLDRRRFLINGVAAVGVASGAGLGGWFLAQRFNVAAARSGVRLPTAKKPASQLPAGVDFRVPGLAPFITSDAAFYRVDTAILVPQVPPHRWRLRIHGMVQREVEIDFAELLRLPLIEDYITLCCVSNPVGGPYIGNARWLGAKLAPLLRRAGIRAGADQLLCTSTDGFTSGTPVQIVMDGRDALLAVGMNGQPLPVAHGFPARLVVPGLYGYVSATKWITDIEVTTYAARTAYWAQRGWAARGPIKTESRIDVPGTGTQIPPGRTTIAGVAWAQHKGIDAVEVRIDDRPWQSARLAAVPGIDTWRQWIAHWDASLGRHRIQARATDATGYTQTAAIAPPEPNGASGYPTITVQVG